jgi:hypothetical protein
MLEKLAPLRKRCQRAHRPQRHNILQPKLAPARKPARMLRCNPQRIPFNSLIASPLLDSEVRNKPSSTRQIARAVPLDLISEADHRDERAEDASDMRPEGEARHSLANSRAIVIFNPMLVQRNATFGMSQQEPCRERCLLWSLAPSQYSFGVRGRPADARSLHVQGISGLRCASDFWVAVTSSTQQNGQLLRGY